MASQVPEGKDTPEYQRVLGNMEKITKALATVPGAKKSLSLKCKGKEWFDVSASISEEELVKLVLLRIEQKADQFDVFVSMLKGITGMDQIVECINFAGKQG